MHNLMLIFYIEVYIGKSKYFKVALKNVEEKKQELQRLSIDDVAYDLRIAAMKAPEASKARALDKLRESKGSKENSAKVQQWLNGSKDSIWNISRRTDYCIS